MTNVIRNTIYLVSIKRSLLINWLTEKYIFFAFAQ